jgi:hypothetical protein
MLKTFPPPYKYSSLSIKDLLDARDAYHWHLSHLTNVVATAIGRYRIRIGDWFEKHPPGTTRDKAWKSPTGEKNLYNTVVTNWSWPCVLVFVQEWLEMHEFSSSPDQMVPRALFLPDGRVVPTCTLRVVEQIAPLEQERKLSFPETYIGGGYLVSTLDQEREHLGSVGCLVTDGNLVYAMTNRHVTGEPGREIFAEFGTSRERVGVSHERQLGKLPFTDAYTEWPGTYVEDNIDAGLIRIDDLSRWTTQIRGLGPLDMPLDLTTQSLTLDLIDCPVHAFGGASGDLRGKIVGLFYRYKSVGGSDYVSDFLIAPRTDTDRSTLPGDSGTLWCLEEPVTTEQTTPADESKSVSKVRYRPFAVQWGGHKIVEQSGEAIRAHSFALATNLSTICRELDLDVLRDWNSGLPEYWGSVGHTTIGQLASNAIAKTNKNLRNLMMTNADHLGKLAVVPDAIWKDYAWKDGGRNPDAQAKPNFPNNQENPNHFADMDKGVPNDVTLTRDDGQKVNAKKGNTLLDLCNDDKNIDVRLWQEYYSSIGENNGGLLPFRVRQIYRAMVKFASTGDRIRFVCAAGILAHYVGDACQPLHISYKFNGDPDQLVPKMHVWNKTKKQWEWKSGEPKASGVHSAYETSMINFASTHKDLSSLVKAALSNGGTIPKIQNEFDAAIVVVDLMRKTQKTLSPDTIINAYAPLQGDPPEQFKSVPTGVASDLWTAVGDKTVKVMATGCRYLAHLWTAAWIAGSGDKKITDLSELTDDALSQRYLDHSFIPSVNLKGIKKVLQDPPA